MFTNGSMIVVTTEPEVTYVIVDRVIGNIPGKGWLIGTKERNMILVRGTEGGGVHTRFLTDLGEYKRLLAEVQRA